MYVIFLCDMGILKPRQKLLEKTFIRKYVCTYMLTVEE